MTNVGNFQSGMGFLYRYNKNKELTNKDTEIKTQIDKDGNGEITNNELTAYKTELVAGADGKEGLSKDDISKLKNGIDLDGDNKISQEEKDFAKGLGTEMEARLKKFGVQYYGSLSTTLNANNELINTTTRGLIEETKNESGQILSSKTLTNKGVALREVVYGTAGTLHNNYTEIIRNAEGKLISNRKVNEKGVQVGYVNYNAHTVSVMQNGKIISPLIKNDNIKNDGALLNIDELYEYANTKLENGQFPSREQINIKITELITGESVTPATSTITASSSSNSTTPTSTTPTSTTPTSTTPTSTTPTSSIRKVSTERVERTDEYLVIKTTKDANDKVIKVETRTYYKTGTYKNREKSRETVIYNEDGTKTVDSSETSYSGKSWSRKSIVSNFDINEKLINKKVTEDRNGDDKVDYQEFTTYEYEADGKSYTRSTKIDKNGDNKIDSQEFQTMEYEDDGKSYTRITKIDKDGDGDIDNVALLGIGYDDKGQINKRVVGTDLDNDGKIDKRKISDQTIKGTSREILEWVNDDGEVTSREIETVINNDNMSISRVYEVDNDGDGEIDYKTVKTSKYNVNGILIGEVYEKDKNADGYIDYRETKTYQYDRGGRKTGEIWEKDVNNDGQLDFRETTTYKYDKYGNRTTNRLVDLDGDGDIDLRSS